MCVEEHSFAGWNRQCIAGQDIAVCHHDRQVGLSSYHQHVPLQVSYSHQAVNPIRRLGLRHRARVYTATHRPADTPPQITAYKANFIGTLRTACMQYAQGTHCASKLSGRRLCRRQRPADCFDTPCNVFSTAYFESIALAVLDSVHTIIFVIIINISCSTAGKQGSTDAYD